MHGPKEVETYLRPVMDLFCRGMEFEVRFNPVDTRSHSLVMEDRSLSVYSIPLKHRIPTCGYLFAEKPKEAHIIREMTDFYQVPVRCMKDIKQGQDYVAPEGEVVPNSRLTRPAAPPKRYAFCSDTAYNRSIIPIIEGADLLDHEATFAECDLARAKKPSIPPHARQRRSPVTPCETPRHRPLFRPLRRPVRTSPGSRSGIPRHDIGE